MNYLAHAYLSFNHSDILAGNMISDFVKGKRKFDYSLGILQGITLHRSIDAFTDSHPATRQAKAFFSARYGLYSGAFIDIVYDHFLANDAAEFTEDSLMRFSQTVYEQLDAMGKSLPEQFMRMFCRMRAENWLYNYRNPPGIRKSFAGLVRRAKYMSEYEPAFQIFSLQYDQLKTCYNDFFPTVRKFAWEFYQGLLL